MLTVVLSFQGFSQTANPDQHKYVFTVAKDGSGDYKYIQDAIDAMRVYPLRRITLYIKNGVYNEKIVLPSDNTDVSFIGESVEKTIISFNDYSGRGKLTTFTSYTAKISKIVDLSATRILFMRRVKMQGNILLIVILKAPLILSSVPLPLFFKVVPLKENQTHILLQPTRHREKSLALFSWIVRSSQIHRLPNYF
jgi:hypothetical protein